MWTVPNVELFPVLKQEDVKRIGKTSLTHGTGGRMKIATTRNDLISDRGQFETLEQDFAEGRRTEREVIVALIRSWLRVLDFLIRRTWGL